MKKAWEMALDLYTNAKPEVLLEEEQGWGVLKKVSEFYDTILKLDWESNVPGSGAPEKIMVAAIQSLENRGYMVEGAYELLEKGYRAIAKNDIVTLHKISAELKNAMLNAKKEESSPYWKYKYYNAFDEYIKKVDIDEFKKVDVTTQKFKEQIQAAWVSQLIGAAMGTMVEGYTSKNLYSAFGDVKDYIREPNTYNDDITFEIAFLDAFKDKGYDVTSKDIALAWIGLIPVGWSAEEIALRNIRAGIFPPQSATFNNPFNEWIGAQMRGSICGMVAPGNPRLAAKLAWKDGEVSHVNNGIFGEIFNACLSSLAFVIDDIEEIIVKSISYIPSDCEYYSVVSFALESCRKHANWQDALKDCEEKYKEYNWIHAYPNACSEIIALMYGESDFEKTLNIVTMCGIDADCNAGMIMPVLGIMKGMCIIPKRLYSSSFNILQTYMRKYEEIKLDDLVDDTILYIKKAKKQEEVK